jgi:hypothetical protein
MDQIDQEIKKRVEEDEKEFFKSIRKKSPEQIEEDNWPAVVTVGMDAVVTAEVLEGYKE